jgi:hypothetical protein
MFAFPSIRIGKHQTTFDSPHPFGPVFSSFAQSYSDSLHIGAVQTIGPQGQPVRFNKDGDAYGSYSFYQYQRHGSKYDYVRIGDWSAS